MRYNKLMAALLVMLIAVIALTTPSEAANKIKFDKKKLAAVELVDANPKLEPLMVGDVVPESVTIFGQAEATQGQMLHYLLKRNPNPKLSCTPKQLVQLYYEEADREGIRPDVALCQAFKETGFFAYGGDVKPTQNNFCGLGATGNKEPGFTFDSAQMGVRAHVQHLLAYTSKRPPKTAIVDPRYILVRDFRKDVFGKAKRWIDLNGVWAVPGKNYGQEIIKLWQQSQAPDGSAESLSAANRSIKLNAPTADMFIYRGLVYFTRGEEGSENDYFNAVDDFESAIMIKSDSTVALYNLAITRERLGKINDAIATYDKLLAIDDDFVQAIYNRGCLKLRNGNYLDSIADFERVLELDDRFAEARNEIGIAHFKLKKYQEAYENIQAPYEINNTNEAITKNKEIMESCVKTKKK